MPGLRGRPDRGQESPQGRLVTAGAPEAVGVVGRQWPRQGYERHAGQAGLLQGLAESLVSGQRTPEAHVVARTGAHEGLPQEAAEALELALEVERRAGCAQDVEWAWDGQRTVLVQARPITVTEGSNRLVKPLDLYVQLQDVLGGRWPTGRRPALWDGRTAERCVTALKRRAGL